MRIARLYLTILCLSGFSVLPVFSQAKQERTVEGLLYDLKHPEPDKRREAARLLGENDLHQAIPDLILLLEDPDGEVRLTAARALLAINDPRALAAFIRMVRQPESQVQKMGIEGIVNIYVTEPSGFVAGVKKVVNFINPMSDDSNTLVVEPYVPVSEDAVRAIADRLFSDDSGVRSDSARALGILRGAAALPAIEDALERETSDSIKVRLIRAIYKIGEPEGGRAVIPFIRDPDKSVHDEAILTVGRLRVREAAAPLNEIYRAGVEERKKIFGLVPVTGADDLQRKVLEALAEIGDTSSREIFEDALQDERDHYRRYGAEGLGRMGDPSYTSLLATRYLREEEGPVRLAFSFALFRLGREEHIVEMVDNVGKDQAFFYLLELSPEKVKILYPYVEAEKKGIKIRLLDVIGLRGDATALPVAQQLVSHEDAEVASAANLAIRRLNARLGG